MTAAPSKVIAAPVGLIPLPGAGSFQDAEMVGVVLVVEDPAAGWKDDGGITGRTVSMKIDTAPEGEEVPTPFVAVAAKL